MTGDGFISLDKVSKHYGLVRACDEVTLGIARGEFFALLGPSGCGKTTLLRLLAGFNAPTSGEIFIDGQSMAGTPPYRRPVNMVFQNYAIFPHLNVRQNIAFGLRKERLSKAELGRRVDEALELIKLPGFGARAASELSGGQRQRVALARALVKKPKVLLLDEPLGALDKKLREQMQIELRQLQKTVGVTFVFVTHDQEEALTLSDRIAVMNEGRVLEVEAPGPLYESPRTKFVADFLGTMNFFEGRVREAANGRVVVETAGLGRVELATRHEVSAGARITIGLRPEKIRLLSRAPAGTVNAVEGRMGPSAYLGDRSHYYVRLMQRDAPVAVAVQNLDRSLASAAGGADRVWLTWAPDAAVLLPAD
ncbi:MAG TPA: ABC transporter ATP-binding protein [Alphaproteobacteria bacterium]|nr:ABC transporter ATP-binding protein [Alphaproteobacteria bacterium]